MKYKTCWISDIHLGTRGCSHERLKKFLTENEFETLYLVGDIIDVWRISKGRYYFPQEHVNLIRMFLSMSKKGTDIIYVAGNHDECLRHVLDYNCTFGNIQFVNEHIYTSLNRQKFLVTHGDDYDQIVLYHKWLAMLGDSAYNFSIFLNTILQHIRTYLGFRPWSLSNYLKKKVKLASTYINSYEQSLVRACKKRDLDGVICGHIHYAQIKEIDGILYCNDGDWVESCTALVETYQGKFEIIQG